jgi:hypothetical protein
MIFCVRLQKHFQRKPFPDDFFKMLLLHEKEYGIQPALLSIDVIFGAVDVSREHKMQMLKLNLNSAAKNVNAAEFIKGLLKYHTKFSGIFSHVLGIIETYTENLEYVFRDTLNLLQLLSDIDNHEFSMKIFGLFAKNPTSYLKIIHSIANISIPAPVLENTKISPRRQEVSPNNANTTSTSAASQPVALEEKSNHKSEPEALPVAKQQLMNSQHIITQLIFQCCDASEFDQQEILRAILRLSRENNATLQSLIEMRPSPTFETLKIVLSTTGCLRFLESPTDVHYQYRLISKQFDTSRVVSAIEGMRDLNQDKSLFYSQRRKLLRQLMLVNRFGYHQNSPIYLREGPVKKAIELTAKDVTDAELRELVVRCRTVFKDGNSTEIEKENARLVFMALIREAMWRITRKFPYSTQMLSVLNTVLHKGSMLSEIDTGEGKGMMMAMMAANLWFEGKAVNVCTSNIELARVSFEEFSPVFDLLGIPRGGKILTSQTPVAEYCYDGINYSDTSQLSLFIAKQKLDPYFIKHHQDDPVSLALDEADYTLLDDSTHYRYATTLHQTDLTWIFDLIYKFIKEDEFKNESNTIEADITLTRKLLFEYANAHQKDAAYIERLSDRQIDTWLDAALTVDKLTEGKDFVVRAESRGVGDDSFNVSFARILANSRVSEGAEWSNGVHQFLHSRLNCERTTQQRKIPYFPIDPETAPIASMSAKNIVEHHKERGRILGVTGTAGSKEELKELADQGIRAFRIPPHSVNLRKSEPPVLVKGETDHFSAIMDSIVRHLRQCEQLNLWSFGYQSDKKPQPILVAFNDIDQSQRFYDYLVKVLDTPKFAAYKNILHSQLLNGSKSIVDNQEKYCPEEEIVSKAGVGGWITVSTLLDRGTDIKPRLNEDDGGQNHPSGLCVLQTFIASERLSRQIIGRAARLGHIGETQLIVDEDEFNTMLSVDAKTLGIEAVNILQQERATTDKSNRRFAGRLGSVKNYFFTKYIKHIQDEKNITPDLNRRWAACLSNMDTEWHRLISEFRVKKDTHGKLLGEREVLAKCTTGLLKRACKDWNFLVPRDESMMVNHTGVESEINEQTSKIPMPEVAVNDGMNHFQLDMNDVSAARHYIENSPLLVTVPTKTEKENAELKKRIAAKDKRLLAAYECVGQIFNAEINLHNPDPSLKVAFENLIEKIFQENSIPYRKKIIEIYAIGQWSNDPEFQKSLSRIFLERLYAFALKKISAFKGENNTIIDRTRIAASALSKEELNIEALLVGLREKLAQKKAQRTAEIEQMNVVQSTVDTAVTFVSSYLYETFPGMLEKLINLIDTDLLFARKEDKLQAALVDAKTNHSFMNSWCVFFNHAATGVDEFKQELTHQNQNELHLQPGVMI